MATSRPLLSGAMLLSLVAYCVGLDNGVGLTPAMGWNSWNRFRCEGLDEKLILEVAEAMVSSGLRDAGYGYVNIDDCWMEKRGADGHIIPFKSKFPSGMKALGDRIHALGLKFGIYSCAGNHTCEGYPASFGYEHIDAADYASWGVDYLKYDYCGMETHNESPQKYYTIMRDALNATGRPILYSLCNWGVGSPHLWGHSVANSWRTGRDVFAAWDEHAVRRELRLPSFLQSIETAIEQQAGYAKYAGPGGFNDPDMLVVGLEGMTPYGIVDECPEHLPAGSCKKGDYVSRQQWGMVGGLTMSEQRAVFSWWCMLAAPLMLGNDPRTMSESTRQLLVAPELLAISQDPLGVQATRVLHDKERRFQVWTKRLTDGAHAVLLFNGADKPTSIAVRWNEQLKEAAAPWLAQVPREPPCANLHDDKGCQSWHASGECTKNPGFMKANCMAACDACPPAKYDGPQATALVRNAWEQEDVGLFIGLFTSTHIEPHEARVYTVRFGKADELHRQMDDRAHARRAELAHHTSRGPNAVAVAAAAATHSRWSVSAQPQPQPHSLVGHAAPVPEHEAAAHPHAESTLPPSLKVCMEEHVDSVMLSVIGVLAACGILICGLARLVTKEAGRTRTWTPSREKAHCHAI